VDRKASGVSGQIELRGNTEESGDEPDTFEVLSVLWRGGRTNKERAARQSADIQVFRDVHRFDLRDKSGNVPA